MLHHASHYLAGRVGLMFLGFVSFPLLTRLLSVSQYGELSLLLKIALLCTVLGKCGLQNAAIRFLPECEGPNGAGRKICVSTLVATSATIALIVVLLALAAVHLQIWKLSSAAIGLVSITLILVFTRSIQPTLSGMLRAEQRTLLFNICELLGKALGIGLSIGALFWIALDLRYYVLGLVVAETSIVAAVLLWFARQGCLSISNIDVSIVRRALIFSTPLIAYELASVVLDSGDRILISHYLGLKQLGFYSAAYSIATYAEQTVMVPINMALFPIYMQIWVEKGETATAEFLSKTLDLFIVLAAALALLVLLTSNDLVAILASKKFQEAHTLLPVLVCGLLVYAIHIFFNAPLLIYKRSFVLGSITVVCCIANIGLNVVLLPKMGIMGAAIATLVSYVFLVIGMAIMSRKYLIFAIPFRNIIVAIGLVPLIYVVCHYISTPYAMLNIACKGFASVCLYGVGTLLFRPDLRRKLAVRYRRSASEISPTIAA
ncbi:MAG: lipopolysaccharide biosynthesis protein [Acidobacteriaceae bacterium]